MPLLYIRTFGCQMNEYDSAKMVDVLRESQGYELTDDPAEADLLLLNTCSVREKAQEKVFSQLGGWKQLKKAKPDLLIGVGGCVASQEGDGIIKRAPYVDLVFGPQTLHRLPDDDRRAQDHRPLGRRRELPRDREVRSRCRSRAPKARRRSSRSWKAAASTARSASCLTRAARK